MEMKERSDKSKTRPEQDEIRMTNKQKVWDNRYVGGIGLTSKLIRTVKNVMNAHL